MQLHPKSIDIVT